MVSRSKYLYIWSTATSLVSPTLLGSCPSRAAYLIKNAFHKVDWQEEVSGINYLWWPILSDWFILAVQWIKDHVNLTPSSVSISMLWMLWFNGKSFIILKATNTSNPPTVGEGLVHCSTTGCSDFLLIYY